MAEKDNQFQGVVESLLKGMDTLIHKSTGISVLVDSDPLTTVVRGTGRTLSDLKFYNSVFIN